MRHELQTMSSQGDAFQWRCACDVTGESATAESALREFADHTANATDETAPPPEGDEADLHLVPEVTDSTTHDLLGVVMKDDRYLWNCSCGRTFVSLTSGGAVAAHQSHSRDELSRARIAAAAALAANSGRAVSGTLPGTSSDNSRPGCLTGVLGFIIIGVIVVLLLGLLFAVVEVLILDPLGIGPDSENNNCVSGLVEAGVDRGTAEIRCG